MYDERLEAGHVHLYHHDTITWPSCIPANLQGSGQSDALLLIALDVVFDTYIAISTDV